MPLIEGSRDLNSFVDIAIKDDDEINPIVSASLLQQSSRSCRSIFLTSPPPSSDDECGSELDLSINNEEGDDIEDVHGSPISSPKLFHGPMFVKSRSYRFQGPGSIAGETQETMSLMTTDLDTMVNSVNTTPHQVVIMDLENQVASLKYEVAEAKSKIDFYELQSRQLHQEFQELQSFCKQLQQENLSLRSGSFRGPVSPNKLGVRQKSSRSSRWTPAMIEENATDYSAVKEEEREGYSSDEESMPPDMDNCSILSGGFSRTGTNDIPPSSNKEQALNAREGYQVTEARTNSEENELDADTTSSSQEGEEGAPHTPKEETLKEILPRSLSPLFFRKKQKDHSKPLKEMRHFDPRLDSKENQEEELSKQIVRNAAPEGSKHIAQMRSVSNQEFVLEKSATPRTLETVGEDDNEDDITPCQSTGEEPKSVASRKSSVIAKHRFERRSSNQWDPRKQRVSIDASSLVDMCLTDEFMDEDDCVSELTLEIPNSRGLKGFIAKLKRRARSQSPTPLEEVGESDVDIFEMQNMLGLSNEASLRLPEPIGS